MRMNADNERAQLAGEAADWFVANRPDGHGLSEEERRRFTRWLESSPDHVEEYMGIAQVAGDLAEAAAGSDAALEELIALARSSTADADEAAAGSNVLPFPVRAPRGNARPGWRRWLPAAVAAGFCVVVAGIGWWKYGPMRDAGGGELRLATAHGGQLTHQMADGSVLRLNTDSAVVVRYSDDRREVRFERGQVLFEVAHDTARPFVVIAGAVEVTAVGTAFEVYMKSDVTQVMVTEGRVRVGMTDGSAGFEPVFLDAGEQLGIRDGQASAVTRVDVQRATAWMRREIVFEGWPLADVAAEFNRYAATPIEIASPDIGRRTITGNFSIDDIDAFLAYLRRLEGVRVESTAGRIVVSRR